MGGVAVRSFFIRDTLHQQMLAAASASSLKDGSGMSGLEGMYRRLPQCKFLTRPRHKERRSASFLPRRRCCHARSAQDPYSKLLAISTLELARSGSAVSPSVTMPLPEKSSVSRSDLPSIFGFVNHPRTKAPRRTNSATTTPANRPSAPTERMRDCAIEGPTPLAS